MGRTKKSLDKSLQKEVSETNFVNEHRKNIIHGNQLFNSWKSLSMTEYKVRPHNFQGSRLKQTHAVSRDLSEIYGNRSTHVNTSSVRSGMKTSHTHKIEPIPEIKSERRIVFNKSLNL